VRHYASHDPAAGCGLMLVGAPIGAAVSALVLLVLGDAFGAEPLAWLGSFLGVVAIALAIAVIAIVVISARDTAAAQDARRRNGRP
jgi:uncharacterized membrane protein YedE/YeeE